MIRRLQALRFVAAALVLIGHSFMEALQHGMTLGPLAGLARLPWGAGVDIFFVISGFIISAAALDRPRGPGAVADFLAHRLIRVWPTYAAFTLLMLAAVMLVPHFLRHARLDPAWIAASFLFVPWPRPDDGRLYPVLGQGWTLNYEMFFYVAFAATLLLPPRRRVAALCLGGVALVALGQVLPLPGLLGFYARPVIAEFLFGVVLSVAYRRITPCPMIGAAMIAAAFAFLAVAAPDTEALWRAVPVGLPAAAIVAGVLLTGEPGERLLGSPLLVLLGNASYALYLSHTFAVNAALLVIGRTVGTVPTPVFLMIAFGAAVAGSLVAYWLIERPALTLLKSRYLRGRTPPRPAPADLQPS